MTKANGAEQALFAYDPDVAVGKLMNTNPWRDRKVKHVIGRKRTGRHIVLILLAVNGRLASLNETQDVMETGPLRREASPTAIVNPEADAGGLVGAEVYKALFGKLHGIPLVLSK
tara:strand:- start:4722 stop:5066 length:345 start_codon:yes stop_codon:yes gene_type:complete